MEEELHRRSIPAYPYTEDMLDQDSETMNSWEGLTLALVVSDTSPIRALAALPFRQVLSACLENAREQG